MSTTEPPAEGDTLARDIMTAPVVTVTPDTSVKDLAALFRDKRIGGMPVVQDGKLVGIVTEGDLMALDADVQYPHYFELFDSIIYLGSQKKFKEQLEKFLFDTADVHGLESLRTGCTGVVPIICVLLVKKCSEK